MTLTLIQGQRGARQQDLCQLSLKVFNSFRLNLAGCWDLLVWWISFSSLLFNIQRREPNLRDFSFKQSNTTEQQQELWLAFRHFQTDFFQNLYDRRHWTIQFDVSVNCPGLFFIIIVPPWMSRWLYLGEQVVFLCHPVADWIIKGRLIMTVCVLSWTSFYTKVKSSLCGIFSSESIIMNELWLFWPV